MKIELSKKLAPVETKISTFCVVRCYAIGFRHEVPEVDDLLNCEHNPKYQSKLGEWFKPQTLIRGNFVDIPWEFDHRDPYKALRHIRELNKTTMVESVKKEYGNRNPSPYAQSTIDCSPYLLLNRSSSDFWFGFRFFAVEIEESSVDLVDKLPLKKRRIETKPISPFYWVLPTQPISHKQLSRVLRQLKKSIRDSDREFKRIDAENRKRGSGRRGASRADCAFADEVGEKICRQVDLNSECEYSGLKKLIEKTDERVHQVIRFNSTNPGELTGFITEGPKSKILKFPSKPEAPPKLTYLS